MDQRLLCSRLDIATSVARAAIQTRLDNAQAFESKARYRRLLLIQYAFYREMNGLYEHPGLLTLLPSLASRRKMSEIVADLYDLGMPIPLQVIPPMSRRLASVDTATAIGQLYVAEGKLLRGTHLLIEARRLGLSEQFGARHLALPPLGRWLSWHALVASIDAWASTEDDIARAVDGAHVAMRTIDMILEDFLPPAQHRRLVTCAN